MKVAGIVFASFVLLLPHSHKLLIMLFDDGVWRSGLQSLELGGKQSVELCDIIGKMLALELNTGEIRIKVRRLVTDYLNKRDIADDPERVLKKIEWSVRVKLEH